MPMLLVYQRRDRRWGWHLQADNRAIVATDGGQGYESYSDAQAMADAIIINGAYENADRRRRSLPD